MSAQIDPALIKLVEALAIADARHDHLFDSERLMKHHLEAAGGKRISTGNRDETRSDLCSVLDRASKPKNRLKIRLLYAALMRLVINSMSLLSLKIRRVLEPRYSAAMV
ncbi:hypothetical protein [Bradyrhizobium neotropicale]|uniref:hypothetical protein n=1 Tax=Bradyrhizobium neotropicale TaxID=1497615 RepID=UPI000B209716|nr:hypothetical protein [Bradyrhizobium neotropicale]